MSTGKPENMRTGLAGRENFGGGIYLLLEVGDCERVVIEWDLEG